MKALIPVTAALLAALLLSGCETTSISTRIEEKSAVFAQLTPEEQENIRQGVVELGYTADMVYMALGKPTRVETKDTPDGPIGLWTFDKYYPSSDVVKMMPAQHSMAYAPPMVAANAPVGPATPRSLRPGSFNTGAVGGPQQSMEPADLVADTLYVMFYKGRVFDMKLASQG